MGQPIYITDPVVAAAYHVAPGEFASVGDDAEAAWLIETHQGYPHDGQRAMPAAGFVHPDAPQPFVAYAGDGGETNPPPDGTQPADMTLHIKSPAAGVFLVTFAGTTDPVVATAHFVVSDADGAVLSDVIYEHPLGTTPEEAADLLCAALVPNAELAVVVVGALVDVRGADPVVVGAVVGELTVPAPAAARSRRRGRHAP